MRPAEPLRRLADWVASQFGYTPVRDRPQTAGRDLTANSERWASVDDAISRLHGVTDTLNELYVTVSADGHTATTEV